ncbi:Tropomyosin [Acromyrmex echinatior]|uniref:Tropomyosin n=1 Tax=Acromyrmex echinatior TaxID=103372 RepID=F4WSG7_ACREC|nr:Tropomyosin [Acromyrmex echinatior]
MDAIKKKMQGMKLEKDNAMDRALLCEQQARDANARAEKAEEEARALQKKIQTIENELDQTQEALMQVNAKLEEKDKALQNTRWRSVWCGGSRAVHIARVASSRRTTRRVSVVGQSLTTAGRDMERAVSATTRRRGHQHHPRHTTRRRLDASSRGPAQCGPADAARNTTFTGDETSLANVTVDCRLGATDPSVTPQVTLGTRWPTRINEIETKDSKTQVLEEEKEKDNEGVRRDDDVRQRLAQCSPDVPVLGESKDAEHDEIQDRPGRKRKTHRFSPRRKNSAENRDERDPRSKSNSPEPEHAVARARGDGNSDDESANVEEDPELAELAKLRCPSERTEVQAEREARRRKRCADYPGLAFGCSIFSSDTMMKFSLIKNELQNIMGNQLKRVSIRRMTTAYRR